MGRFWEIHAENFLKLGVFFGKLRMFLMNPYGEFSKKLFYKANQIALLNHSVVLLQALDSTFTTIAVFNWLNALYRSQGTGQSCNIRNLVFQTSLADCFSVFGVVAFCLWRIDDKTYFLIKNNVNDIRTTSQGLRIIDSARRKADIFRFLNRVSVCCLL